MSQEVIIASLISRIEYLEKIVNQLQTQVDLHSKVPHLSARDVLLNSTNWKNF